MSPRKKNSVRKGFGIRCLICAKNCGKGGSLKKHVEIKHKLGYNKYLRTFKHRKVDNVYETWHQPELLANGKMKVIHVMTRTFIRVPGKRDKLKTKETV